MLKKVTVYDISKYNINIWMINGLPKFNIFPNKNIIAVQYLDEHERLVKVIHSNKSCTELYKYYGDTNIYKEKTTIYSYDDTDYDKDTIICNEKGQAILVKEGKNTFEYEYDEYGILKQIIISLNDYSTTTIENDNFSYKQHNGITQISYHNCRKDCNVIVMLNQDGKIIYKKDSGIEVQTQYNDKGKPVRIEEKYLELGDHEETTYLYDPEGRILNITLRSLISGEKLNETIRQYNRNGFKIYESYKDYTMPQNELLSFGINSINDNEVYYFCADNGVLFDYDKRGKIYNYYKYENVEEDSVKLDY